MKEPVVDIYSRLGDAVDANTVAHNYYLATGKKLKINTKAHKDVLIDNPYIELTQQEPKFRLHYKGGLVNAQFGNIIQGITYQLSQKAETAIPCVNTDPELYYASESMERPLNGPYVVLACGWYESCSVKNIGRAQTQLLVDSFPDIHFVQTGVCDKTNHQPFLYGNNVTCLVNKTSKKEFAAVLKYASMAVGPVSSFAHIAACYKTPAMIVAGHRQKPILTSFTNSYHITTTCDKGPCMQFYAKGNKDHKACPYVVNIEQELIPACMVIPDLADKFKELYDKYARK